MFVLRAPLPDGLPTRVCAPRPPASFTAYLAVFVPPAPLTAYLPVFVPYLYAVKPMVVSTLSSYAGAGQARGQHTQAPVQGRTGQYRGRHIEGQARARGSTRCAGCRGRAY